MTESKNPSDEFLSGLQSIAVQRNYTILDTQNIQEKSIYVLSIQCNNCGAIKKPTIIDFKRKTNNCRCNMSKDVKPLYTIINKCKGIYSKKYEIDRVDDCYQISPEGSVSNINTRRPLKIYVEEDSSGKTTKYVSLRLKDENKTKKYNVDVLYACCIVEQPATEECEIQKVSNIISWKLPKPCGLDLSKYYDGVNFKIGINDFNDIKSKYTEDEFTEAIMKVLELFPRPIMSVYTDELTTNDYQSIHTDTSEVKMVKIKDVLTPVIIANTKGVKLLNHFTDSVLIYTHKYRKPSYEEAWKNLELRELLVRRMIKKDKRVNNRGLFGCFACQFGRLFNFPPNLAKYVYNTYGKGGRVLDFCAGFGGRLLGYWVSNCTEYIGIDPNRNVPYNQIIKYLETFKNKKAQVFYECAEDFDYSLHGKFDIIFTSPPYFNTEIYSEDPSQSCHRYKNSNVWLENFLYKTLSKCSDALKSDGTLAINIKNCGKIDLVNPMINYIESLGFTEKERIMISQSKRYSNNKTYEYIYVFQK